MLGIVDLELADIDVDAGWNGVGAAAHLNGVSDDADRTAAFDAGRLVGVSDMDRNVDADGGALAESHEIHMQRQVAHGIELEVAGNHAMLHAVDLDVMNGRQKTPGIDAVVQIGIVERDRQRRLAVAIDDSGNAAGTTFCPGGPLAGPRTRRRLDQIDGRHDGYPCLKLCSIRENPRRASRGAVAAAAAALIAARALKNKEKAEKSIRDAARINRR